MSQQSSQRGGQGFAMDYIDVAQRIADFREKHPEGCLQPADPSVPFRIETIQEQTYIVVVAAAYRSPDDPRPGIGMAYEVFPGRTPYTRGSELQNAETSAWGRAIVAVLAGDTKRSIASAEEVRNRRAEQEAPVQQVPRRSDPSGDSRRPAPASERDPAIMKLINEVARAAEAAGIPKEDVLLRWAQDYEGQDIRQATSASGLAALRDEYLAKAPERGVA